LKIGSMAYIPKRAVGHMKYLSGAEVQITTLKPGVDDVIKTGFYDTASAPYPPRDHYIADKQFDASIYQKTISQNTIPKDYEDIFNDRLRRTLKAQEDVDRRKKQADGGTHTAGHWKSTYGECFSQEDVINGRCEKRKAFARDALNPPTCVSQPLENTTFQADFGFYGSNPRNLIDPLSRSLPNRKSCLSLGTPLGTNHIAGYQGFLPTNTHNPRCARVEAGLETRNPMKVNLSETYLQNIPFYGGHVPVDARNDRGPRQVNTLSCMGRSFSTTRW